MSQARAACGACRWPFAAQPVDIRTEPRRFILLQGFMIFPIPTLAQSVRCRMDFVENLCRVLEIRPKDKYPCRKEHSASSPGLLPKIGTHEDNGVKLCDVTRVTVCPPCGGYHPLPGTRDRLSLEKGGFATFSWFSAPAQILFRIPN